MPKDEESARELRRELDALRRRVDALELGGFKDDALRRRLAQDLIAEIPKKHPARGPPDEPETFDFP